MEVGVIMEVGQLVPLTSTVEYVHKAELGHVPTLLQLEEVETALDPVQKSGTATNVQV